jgi:restriction system protein
MAVPDFQSMMLPFLEITGDGQVHTTSEVIQRLADGFQLSQEDREELLPSGTQRRLNNRVKWVAAHFRKAGLIESMGPGKFKITSRGQSILASTPQKIDMKFLIQFPGYFEFISGGKPEPGIAAPKPTPVDVEQTPEELIDVTHRQLEEGLAQQLLDKVLSLSPTFFEQLVVDLLLKMGYGGSPEAGQRLGKSDRRNDQSRCLGAGCRLHPSEAMAGRSRSSRPAGLHREPRRQQGGQGRDYHHVDILPRRDCLRWYRFEADRAH